MSKISQMSDELESVYSFYKHYFDNIEDYIPEDWSFYQKYKTRRKERPDLQIPFQVVNWVIRKEITKQLFTKVANSLQISYDLEKSEINTLIDDHPFLPEFEIFHQ